MVTKSEFEKKELLSKNGKERSAFGELNIQFLTVCLFSGHLYNHLLN
jgi:hypothetical protein